MLENRGTQVLGRAFGRIALFWLVIGVWTGLALWSAAARGLKEVRRPGAMRVVS
jgi:hypothetical protein